MINTNLNRIFLPIIVGLSLIILLLISINTTWLTLAQTDPFELVVEPGYKAMEIRWPVFESPDVTRYRLTRSETQVDFTEIAILDDTFYYDTDEDLEPNRQYCYRVEALHTNGQVVDITPSMCRTFGKVELWLQDVSGISGTLVKLPLNIRNARDLFMGRANLWIDYDSTVLEPLTISHTALTQGYNWTSTITQTEGASAAQIGISFSAPPRLIGEGTLFWLNFRVITDTYTRTIVYLRQPPNPQIGTCEAGMTESCFGDLDYNQIPFTVREGRIYNLAPYILGDTDGSEVVDQADIPATLRLATGEVSPIYAQTQGSDMNGDDSLDAADATMIAHYVAHNYWAVPGYHTYPGGPVNSTPKISLARVKALPDSTVNISLQAEDLNEWAGGSFVIIYDPTFLEPVAVDTDDLTGDFELAWDDDGEGGLTIALANAEAVSGDGTIATLQFKVDPSAPLNEIYPLNLVQIRLNDIYGRDFTNSVLSANIQRVHGQIQIKSPGPDFSLSPGYTLMANEGEVVTYTHTLVNTGDQTDTFILQAHNADNWHLILGATVLGNGSLGGSMNMGSHMLPLTLGAAQTAQVYLQVTVPADLFAGSLGGTFVGETFSSRTTLTVTSQADVALSTSIVDITTIPHNVTSGYQLYLPLITKNRLSLVLDGDNIKAGVDFGTNVYTEGLISQDYANVKTMGADWVRISIPWYQIEATPGVYNWTKIDREIEALVANGLKPHAVIRGWPDWAAPTRCGPITDITAFEAFLDQVTLRYGAEIDTWEFVNEPDAYEPYPWEDGALLGCWGNTPAEYATHLGIFYNHIKSHNSSDVVFLGGMAYDAWDIFNRDFFTQTLAAGAGQYLDGVSFHYYPINPVDFPSVKDKITEIQGTMATYNIEDKLLWLTETGMWVNKEGSLDAQQNFITKEQTRAYCNGVDNIFWFAVREEDTITPDLYRWLINKEHEPDNGYDTYQHYMSLIKDQHCTSYQLESFPETIEAYHLDLGNRWLTILWSNAGLQEVSLSTLNEGTLTGRDGNITFPLPQADGHVWFAVGEQAVFVEMMK